MAYGMDQLQSMGARVGMAGELGQQSAPAPRRSALDLANALSHGQGHVNQALEMLLSRLRSAPEDPRVMAPDPGEQPLFDALTTLEQRQDHTKRLIAEIEQFV